MKRTERASLSSFAQCWQLFCRLIVKIFYRKCEIAGAEHVPKGKGIVLCANHVNALVDPVIVQASTSLVIRPLARSGLFQKPLLGWWLNKLGAVPIFRPSDAGSDIQQNKDSFSRCYELLGAGATLIIFPEGQSHSDSHLHRLKSGAARLIIGSIKANIEAPAVIPVGLNFSRKGNFRGDVLVNFGPPIGLEMPESFTSRQTVREVNERISAGLRAVTINAGTWDQVDLVRRLEKFFALRRGKIRRGNLHQRFSALQRLIDGQQLLLEHEPELVRSVTNKLRAYERLCKRYGVRDYHLTLNYRPWFILVHSVRMVLTFLFGLPLLIFAIVNGGVPYILTGYLSKRLAEG